MNIREMMKSIHRLLQAIQDDKGWYDMTEYQRTQILAAHAISDHWLANDEDLKKRVEAAGQVA